MSAEQSTIVQYAKDLAELTFNSKPIINNLTIIAGENKNLAPAISSLIVNRVSEVPVDQILPSLYLLDSITKNIGEPYKSVFAQSIMGVFYGAYQKIATHLQAQMNMDQKMAFSQQLQRMERLLDTWPNHFGPALVSSIRTLIAPIKQAASLVMTPITPQINQILQKSNEPTGDVMGMLNMLQNSIQAHTAAPPAPITPVAVPVAIPLPTQVALPQVATNPIPTVPIPVTVPGANPAFVVPPSFIPTVPTAVPPAFNPDPNAFFNPNVNPTPSAFPGAAFPGLYPQVPQFNPALNSLLIQQLMEVVASGNVPPQLRGLLGMGAPLVPENPVTPITPILPVVAAPPVDFHPPIDSSVHQHQHKSQPPPSSFNNRNGHHKELSTNSNHNPIVNPEAYFRDHNLAFDLSSLKIRNQTLVDTLYQMTNCCSSCGLRFRDLAKLRVHLDWHFQVNAKDSEKTKRPVSQPWFPSASEWVVDMSNRKIAEDKEEKEKADEGPSMINADDSQPNCHICGEAFERIFDTEEDDWMYTNVVVQPESKKIVHKECSALNSPPHAPLSLENLQSPPPSSSSSSSSFDHNGSDLGKRSRQEAGVRVEEGPYAPPLKFNTPPHS